MRILITGTAGFIGYHLAQRLLAEGHTVIGIDGITPYYDQGLKRQRQARLATSGAFTAHELMLEDARLAAVVREARAERVFHLAAQPGVRYSTENPRAYIDSNVVGTFNLLQALLATPCRHLLIASTSSVYGANAKRPFEERDCTEQPQSLYAATKKATEAMAFSHAHLTAMPTTVLRFFTVYGPWGRPDMALFKFTQNIIAGLPIEVYGEGKMTRDFTYIDDVIEATCRLADRVPARENLPPAGGAPAPAPYRVVNVAGGRPVELEAFIAVIERAVGRKALRKNLPMQPGDVRATHAGTAVLEALTGFRPQTSIEQGIAAFVAWYRDYFRA
jgi:UDP-glucuronate 4-epimerase